MKTIVIDQSRWIPGDVRKYQAVPNGTERKVACHCFLGFLARDLGVFRSRMELEPMELVSGGSTDLVIEHIAEELRLLRGEAQDKVSDYVSALERGVEANDDGNITLRETKKAIRRSAKELGYKVKFKGQPSPWIREKKRKV